MRFSMIHDPWVPVLGERGYEEVGVVEALARAEELRLAPEAYEEVPLVRFLLFVLAWAFQGEDEGEVRGASGRELALRLEEALGPFADRFDLFAEHFALCPDLSGSPGGPEVLRPDWPSGGNALLATPRPLRPLRLRPAEAARYLLVALAYTPSGLHNKHGVTTLSGGSLSGGVAFYALAPRLIDTLRLNLVLPRGRLRAPWESPPFREASVWGYAGGGGEEPLNRYLAVPFSFRFYWEGDWLVGVTRGPGYRPASLQRVRDPMFAYRGESPLGLLPGQRLLEGALPRFGEASPPEVLERAEEFSLETGVAYAVRAIAQVSDQSAVPALLGATLPPILRPEESYRIRLGEVAEGLLQGFGRALRALGVERGRGGAGWAHLSRFQQALERAVLTAKGEEEGRRTLYALAREEADRLLLERLRTPEKLLRLRRLLERAVEEAFTSA